MEDGTRNRVSEGYTSEGIGVLAWAMRLSPIPLGIYVKLFQEEAIVNLVGNGTVLADAVESEVSCFAAIVGLMFVGWLISHTRSR